MSRIADLASTQRVLNFIFETQERARESELRVASGKVSQSYDNIFLQSQQLITIENLNIEANRFRETNATADLRLDLAGTAVEGTLDIIQNFRTLLADFNNTTKENEFDVDNIQEAAYDSLTAMQDLLNSQADGIFIFSGSKFDTPPVELNLSSLTDFQNTYDGVSVTYPTTRDAHLENFSLSNDTQNENRLFTTDTNFLTFRQDDDLDTSTSGRSSIEATSDLFAGLNADTQITITNTANNNGTYTIDEVSSDGTKIFLKTEMLTDETAPAALSDQGLNSGFAAGEVNVARSISRVSENPDTVQAFTDVTINVGAGTITDNSALNADLTASGIATGDIIQINDGGNIGFYTVQDVTGAVITIDTDAAPTTTITPSGGTAITLADAGSLHFDADLNQITAETAGAFDAISVDQIITVANTGETSSANTNDRSYRVTAKTGDVLTVEDATTVTLADPDNTLRDDAILEASDYGALTFSRANNTITATTANAFQNAVVGQTITVGNSGQNNGTYTVTAISADGTTVTVDSTKLTNEGTSGTTYFDHPSFTQVQFTRNGTGTDTIQVQDSGGGALDVFSRFKVGQSITLAGSGADDGTFTINAISTDGSTITIDEDLPSAATSTDTDSITITGAANTNFSYTTQTNLEFSAANRITVHDDANNTINGSFDALRAGQTITIANATTAGNNGTYLISSVDVDGGFVEVTELDGTAVTFTAESGVAATTMQVNAADGTIAANSSYYDGDTVTLTQRVDSDRSFTWDVTAIDPAFEKAIRAMGIIAQGVFGTEGGLDQNQDRVDDALFLLDHALQPNPQPRAGFNEIKGNIQSIIGDIGFDAFVVESANENHINNINVYNGRISDIEDVDQLEAVTQLLDDGRALEASYQALSRIEGLSLVNFLN